MKKNAVDIAKEVRKRLVRMHRRGPHFASALSAVDILTVLYFKVMNIKSPDDPERDRFILSKGQGVSALYAVLAEKGFFSEDMLEEYISDGSLLYGHPVKDTVSGIEVSTGALGHGLPIGVGIALAAKIDNRKFKIYILMGDGECQEGSVWEGAMQASRFGLDNIVTIVDANKLQGYGAVDAILPVKSLRAKWKAFGWAAEEVNGHKIDELKRTLSKIPFVKNKPSAIIAHTVKGKGISEAEDRLDWHYLSVPNHKIGPFISQLDRQI